VLSTKQVIHEAILSPEKLGIYLLKKKKGTLTGVEKKSRMGKQKGGKNCLGWIGS